MIQYAQAHELEEDVTMAFVSVIRSLDIVFLEWEAAEAESKRNAK